MTQVFTGKFYSLFYGIFLLGFLTSKIRNFDGNFCFFHKFLKFLFFFENSNQTCLGGGGGCLGFTFFGCGGGGGDLPIFSSFLSFTFCLVRSRLAAFCFSLRSSSAFFSCSSSRWRSASASSLSFSNASRS